MMARGRPGKKKRERGKKKGEVDHNQDSIPTLLRGNGDKKKEQQQREE